MIRKSLVGFVLLTASAFFVAAQDLPLRSGPGAERLEQFKKVRLLETLKLEEETSIRFLSRYNKHQEAIREVNQRRNALIDQLQAITKTGAGDAEVEKIVRELIATETKVTEARNKFLADLKDVLSMKQIAQVIVFERNFYRDVRDIMREMAQERQGRLQRRRVD